MNYLVSALVMGVGATVLVDLWAIARRRAFNIPLPDYGLVGRWFAHLARVGFATNRSRPPQRSMASA